jgi:hypothetical protein
MNTDYNFWQSIIGGLISGGVVSMLIGAIATMTWGRLMDRFNEINRRVDKCENCIVDIYHINGNQDRKIAVLEK